MIDAWNALRNNQPYGLPVALQDINEELQELRSSITKQELENVKKEKPKMTSNRLKFPKTKNKEHCSNPKTCSTGKIVGYREFRPKANQSDFGFVFYDTENNETDQDINQHSDDYEKS
ncbi:hypothetical protein GPJ56_009134 [Histomonas meleagridis]|uniref:uncharacterized protein n=1 Tax=Histomonas meleagridis TaxID=135588 RepID=UPI00355A2318|nr:hypothetical protein GPJ56_009134 [Histomonas meleagridis]KAH0799209.1 hypothetical protein GO595_008006 [Histomonas meleagridis]